MTVVADSESTETKKRCRSVSWSELTESRWQNRPKNYTSMRWSQQYGANFELTWYNEEGVPEKELEGKHEKACDYATHALQNLSLHKAERKRG